MISSFDKALAAFIISGLSIAAMWWGFEEGGPNAERGIVVATVLMGFSGVIVYLVPNLKPTIDQVKESLARKNG